MLLPNWKNTDSDLKIFFIYPLGQDAKKTKEDGRYFRGSTNYELSWLKRANIRETQMIVKLQVKNPHHIK